MTLRIDFIFGFGTVEGPVDTKHLVNEVAGEELAHQPKHSRQLKAAPALYGSLSLETRLIVGCLFSL